MGPFDATLLAATIALTTPLLLAAVGELIAEKAGVMNIGLEGMILMGAFFAFLVAYETGSTLAAVLAGAAAGALLAAVMALLAVEARADQIVVGVGLNIVALGLTTFLFEELFGDKGQVVVDRIGDWEIPGLSQLPVVGKAFFSQSPLVYLAFLLVPAVWFLLQRTNWGLMIRGAGEVPEAVDTAGASIARVRWLATLAAGVGAGLAGAFLSVGQTGLFTDNMSAGRGFLALAAVIFARWRIGGIVLACLVFGGADALQLRLQAADHVPTQVWVAIALAAGCYAVVRASRSSWRAPRPIAIAALVCGAMVALAIASPSLSLPSQLWLSVPYLFALLALAGFVGHARMPSALTVPYRRGGESL
jgi:ABC-type uncharacterized transport system permease subunit